jgi:A/G-specific adenine glycosylase
MAWYDIHARDLPWRVGPHTLARGVRPDPYAVWLSEVMLQQTTVAAVRHYFHRFTTRWPRVQDLAAAEDAEVMAEWAGLGYYARARNLLKCARVVTFDLGGRFPDTEDGLQALPGIGPYTAAAIASIAFDRSATVLDGNIERVMSRLFAVTEPLPGSKPTLKALAARLTPMDRPGCHAQALMDIGATICTPKSPACGICPLMPACEGRRTGIAADLPAKTPKKAKPLRHGIAYLVRRTDGAFLLETRPPSGLLGGMLGWPSPTGWRAIRHRHPRFRPIGTPRGWRCATPSPISTCACPCSWPWSTPTPPPTAVRSSTGTPFGPVLCRLSCARPTTFRRTAGRRFLCRNDATGPARAY